MSYVVDRPLVEVDFEDLPSLEAALESGPFLLVDLLWEDLLGDFTAAFLDESFFNAAFSRTSEVGSESKRPNKAFVAFVSG